jgi:hypothetical protein
MYFVYMIIISFVHCASSIHILSTLLKACLPVGAAALGEPWPPLQPVSTWC